MVRFFLMYKVKNCLKKEGKVGYILAALKKCLNPQRRGQIAKRCFCVNQCNFRPKPFLSDTLSKPVLRGGICNRKCRPLCVVFYKFFLTVLI